MANYKNSVGNHSVGRGRFGVGVGGGVEGVDCTPLSGQLQCSYNTYGSWINYGTPLPNFTS